MRAVEERGREVAGDGVGGDGGRGHAVEDGEAEHVSVDCQVLNGLIDFVLGKEFVCSGVICIE